MSEMRNGISNRNITTRPNADTRLTPKEFRGPDINQQIAIREPGGVAAFNDFVGHLSQVEELRREEGMR